MKPSLFHDTLTRLEGSLTCELIASDLDMNPGIKLITTSAEEMLEYALERNFTRVPLHDPQSRSSGVTHLALINLQEARLEATRPVSPDDLIAGDTPISRAIPVLRDRGFCFVLVQDSISKILTRSDLNKLPVRVYLNMLVAHLESLLADAIHNSYPNNTWLQLLSDGRQTQARNLFEQKVAEEFDTRLIDCTTLSDKSTIVKKAAEVLKQVYDGSKKEYDSRFTLIRLLRNRIDHTLPALTEDNDMLRDHLVHGQHLTKVKDVKWLAEVVHTMQIWIDRLTQES